jgi:ABC-type lipoprotein release transport system permease subunit
LAANLGILVVFNSVGLLLSAVGGRIGGALAILLAKQLQQSHKQDM